MERVRAKISRNFSATKQENRETVRHGTGTYHLEIGRVEQLLGKRSWEKLLRVCVCVCVCVCVSIYIGSGSESENTRVFD